MNNKPIYFQLHRKELLPLISKKYSKVLEIGCGEGGFRRSLSQDNEYWGVEPVTAIAKIAFNNLDTVLTGTYQEVANQIPDNYFDLVICNDVIEHLPDHDQFLQSIKTKMKPEGDLIGSIPNVRHVANLLKLLVLKDWKYEDEGILDKTHLRFFTKKSIMRTVTDNGFCIEKIIGLNSYAPKSFFKRSVCLILSILLGQDIKFLQFGIRITQQKE